MSELFNDFRETCGLTILRHFKQNTDIFDIFIMQIYIKVTNNDILSKYHPILSTQAAVTMVTSLGKRDYFSQPSVCRFLTNIPPV